jgi:FAD synthase
VIIIPLAKIRDNQQFSSVEMLQEQIQKDLNRAKNNPQYVITFGTFDYFHR